MNTNIINSALQKAGFRKATRHLTSGLINYDGFWVYKAGDSILVENRIVGASVNPMFEALEEAGYRVQIDGFTGKIAVLGAKD